MMGRLKSTNGQLFYEFHLGDAVPEDRVRKIDKLRHWQRLRILSAMQHVDQTPRGRGW